MKRVLLFVSFLFISIHSSQACESTATDADVVIIGGGLSGHSAALALQEGGIKNVVLYEGREDRLGGRTHTHHFGQDKKAYYEEGGTFIDSDHTHMQALAKKLGVTLEKRGLGTGGIYVIQNSQVLSEQKFAAGLKETYQELNSKQLSHDQLYNSDGTHQCAHLELSTDFGGKFVDTYFTDEAGVDPVNMPASAQKWIIESLKGYSQLLQNRVNPEVSNKVIDAQAYKYTVKGGLSQLIKALENKLKPTTSFHLGHKLTEISKVDGQYKLIFDSKNLGQQIVYAKHVLLTLPFSTLRLVRIEKSVPITQFQRDSIQQLSYGNHIKIGVPIQGSKNIADDLRYYVNLDQQFFGWPGHNAMTYYIGGSKSKSCDLDELKQIISESGQHIKDAHPYIKSYGELKVKDWNTDPFSKGSHSITRAGDKSSLWKTSDKDKRLKEFADSPDGQLFFAGEHVMSNETAGFMEGAVRSGEIAAEQILEAQ